MTAFLMPALGADMEDGTVVEWLVKPGDRVRSGDIVAVVETQKGAIEVEAFLNGTVRGIVAPVGTRVPVGAVLAEIDEGTTPPQPAPAQPSPPRPIPPVPAAVPPPLAPQPAPRRTAAEPRPRISPAARVLAAARGIDPAGLRGSGVDGAVTRADVLAAAAPAAEGAAPSTAPPVRRGFDPAEMRRAIAAAMARAKREVPHYYLSETIDMAAALAWLDRHNATVPPPGRILPAALLLKATALALREVPALNGAWQDGGFVPAAGIHVGWAIALRGGGLVAPAIRDADRAALPALMSALRDLVGRARNGRLRLSELTGGTVTVTSLGERGAESVTGVIYPPQVALVGLGRIAARALVVDGRVEPRPAVTATLAADHRASDGHTGGQFLAALARLLQEPQSL
jgi:pyruvate dehydrogenase E2 component (dihydrolipoamide acetyltransferase)